MAGTWLYHGRGPGRVVGSVAVSQRPCRTPPAPSREPSAPAQRRVVGLAAHCIATQCPALPLVFQLAAVTIQCLYRDPTCLPSRVSCNTLSSSLYHDTVVHCNTLQHPSCLKLSQYTNCITTHFPAKPVPQSRY